MALSRLSVELPAYLTKVVRPIATLRLHWVRLWHGWVDRADASELWDYEIDPTRASEESIKDRESRREKADEPPGED